MPAPLSVLTRRARASAGLLAQAFREWSDDEVPILGAALSYYTAFSIAPLLIIAIGVAGLAFGADAARGEIVSSLQGLVGRSGAQAIQTMIESTSQKNDGVWATVVGAVTLLIGATTVFAQLQHALNLIWKTRPKPGNWVTSFVRERLLSFALVLVIGFLLLVSLVASAGLAALGRFLGGVLPGGAGVWQAINFVVSLGISTALFGAIFKVLPDARIAWRDVWLGAGVTAVLFSLGRFAIGAYLGSSAIASSFGAFGSLVIVLVWVYYSSQILFFGAEFTKVFARRYGSHRHRRRPPSNVVRIDSPRPAGKRYLTASTAKKRHERPGDRSSSDRQPE